jgi:putative phage-type endonuclease
MEVAANQIEELQNIIDSFVLPDIFTTKEYDNLIEVAGILIDDLITSDISIYKLYEFENIVINNVFELIHYSIKDLYSFSIEDELINIIKKALKIYYTYINPPRSYDKTFIRKSINKNKMKNKIDYLKNIPQPDQRTNDWYIFRHNMLTASSIWKVFDSESAKNQIIYDKCAPLDLNKYNNFSTDSPMHWGQKYEPLSIMWYENKYKTQITDFGCIPHDKYKFIGASPDGINTDINNDRYGRMLEIKNIVNRDITGIPKMEYWIQMQFQMEVCKLNECDFLETRFIEYDDEESFINDGTFNLSSNNEIKGVIIYFIKNEKPFYEYCPFMCNKEEFIKWEENIMSKNSNITWMKNIYWKLSEISCVLVLRNKNWFNKVLSDVKNIWDIIEYEKINGYQHRAPKKKSKINSPIIKSINTSKCFINIDNILNDTFDNNTTKISCETFTDNNKIINISTNHLDI